MIKQRAVLVPQYMRQFTCIGSDCEDSCCIGWHVSIDKTTYKKYAKVRDRELRLKLDKAIIRNRASTSPETYAEIKFENSPRCPLLTEEKLCSVQMKLGENYLSNTCSIYPRLTNKVNNKWEKSGSISCPEIARLALLNPAGLEFDEVLEPDDPRNTWSGLIDTASSDRKYFWELRIFTIQVLQDRNYSLTERLIILGMFYQKAQKCLDEARFDDIPTLISQYTSLLKSGVFAEELQSIPVEHGVQMELLKTLVDIRFNKGISSKRYSECIAEFLHGIAYHSDASTEEITARYAEAYEQYYLPFMTKHEYILENYLVNYVFSKLFPYSNRQTFYDNYVTLVIHYSLIKLHLIGMAGYHKEAFSTELVLKLIQSLAKAVEHDNKYVSSIHSLLKDNGYTTLGYMAILIKN